MDWHQAVSQLLVCARACKGNGCVLGADDLLPVRAARYFPKVDFGCSQALEYAALTTPGLECFPSNLHFASSLLPESLELGEMGYIVVVCAACPQPNLSQPRLLRTSRNFTTLFAHTHTMLLTIAWVVSLDKPFRVHSFTQHGAGPSRVSDELLVLRHRQMTLSARKRKRLQISCWIGCTRCMIT